MVFCLPFSRVLANAKKYGNMSCIYTAVFLYMNYASYNEYIKKLLGLIFILSDDFSMFKAKDNRDSDLLMCFTYHTHNVYLKDREITDFA